MIVVDVGSATAFEFDCGESLSTWRLLWRRIMPFVKRLAVPSIGAILMRTTEVSSPQRANGRCAKPTCGCADRSTSLACSTLRESTRSSMRVSGMPKQTPRQLKADPSMAAIVPPPRDRPLASDMNRTSIS